MIFGGMNIMFMFFMKSLVLFLIYFSWIILVVKVVSRNSMLRMFFGIGRLKVELVNFLRV